ncbi:MAG: hypothetical protein N2747_05065 [Chitinophagaceae bacterium]|nr:hypothetical protein [Chitinophagaceae bacterium]
MAMYFGMYNPNAYNRSIITSSAFWLFRNFWDVSLETGFVPFEHDYFVLGDPLTYRRCVKRPSYGFVNLNGSTTAEKNCS